MTGREKTLKALTEGWDYKASLIDGTDADPSSFDGVIITSIVNDNRGITPGCLFLCIRGANFDGHTAAADAVRGGARVIVTEQDIDLSGLTGKEREEAKDTLILRTDSTRYAMAFVAAAWYDHPARELKTIGITGTKGKTTTTWLVRNMLERSGIPCGLIGTIGVVVRDGLRHADNTTPESTKLQELFREMADAGCKAVVMEVSSQALMLHRTQGFTFDLGLFTNLEPDHIGENEHSDFEDYLNCKSLLFKQCRTGIINIDDAHAEDIIKGHTCDIETYGFSEKADLRAVNLAYIHKPGELGVFFDAEGLINLHAEIPNPGKFSVYNALCAIAVARHFDCTGETITGALKEAKVKGRIELVPVSDSFSLMIDYAHNAMALKSLLTTLKDYRPKRLVCVFGCGGNRARSRRYEMGEVSGKLADLTIITSDNPRYEEPLDIMKDIEEGVRKTEGHYLMIEDRREAIRYAIENGEQGDVIVLAGKGHEDYQEIRGVKYPMDERVLISEILSELKGV